MKAGDLGSLPIILGLIAIAIIFQMLNQNYLTPRNFVNLIVQMAGITTIAIGVVLLLLDGFKTPQPAASDDLGTSNSPAKG